jgi:hypothetical protein
MGIHELLGTFDPDAFATRVPVFSARLDLGEGTRKYLLLRQNIPMSEVKGVIRMPLHLAIVVLVVVHWCQILVVAHFFKKKKTSHPLLTNQVFISRYF